MDLREMLRQEVEAWKRLGADQPMLKEVILEHGQSYELDRESSEAYGKGILRNCFENAARAALWDDDLTYVEGFAFRADRGIMPVHHAWVVNAEGKALDLTWRDGGFDCGFCIDGQRDRDEDEDGYDQDDEETWTETCSWCGGTGERDDEHPTLEGAQYIGIAVDNKTLVGIISRNDLWGVMHTEQDLKDVLAASA